MTEEFKKRLNKYGRECFNALKKAKGSSYIDVYFPLTENSGVFLYSEEIYNDEFDFYKSVDNFREHIDNVFREIKKRYYVFHESPISIRKFDSYDVLDESDLVFIIKNYQNDDSFSELGRYKTEFGDIIFAEPFFHMILFD